MFIDHRYKVLESLGTGTWANVYHVQDIRSGNDFTLKLFKYLASNELYERFSAEEMHHITKIEHPNLNNVLDFGHVGDHVYFLSEYFNGSTLNAFRYSKHRQTQFFDIIIQISYALHALHSQNILHKDLKLENILFKDDNNEITIKLIDYGFSKLDMQSETKRVSGTLPYMAPEIYLGKNASVMSDFYSLGVILYRITTGAFPYTMDQINALITGSHQYFIPVFPSELNPEIPLALEKFILKLLEKNPENRFHTSEEIIGYVNRIQSKQYPFSLTWSMVNSLRFNSYIVRGKISHQLLDYLPAVCTGNGKTISILGGDGLGKDNILSLFKYHLLNGEYFLYDYTCTKTHHEAFFALIKEYLESLAPEQIQKSEKIQKISGKFHEYLFKSEHEAKNISQSAEELKLDFEIVKDLLIELSDHKPVVFIIRNFQFVHQHTIDFINFISSLIVSSKIMIVISCTDFNKVNKIEHTAIINIPNLDETESREYINKLLRVNAPESFCHWIYHRSSGNPFFIQEILVDLINNKSILNTKKSVKAEFLPSSKADQQENGSFGSWESIKNQTKESPEDSYQLPTRLLHAIYSKMSHLTADNYAYLQKLAIAQTPLNRDLIVYLLKLDDQQLYAQLNDAIYNEILFKKDKQYFFTYLEAKDHFVSECNPDTITQISKQIISFFDKTIVHDIVTVKGVIANAKMADDTHSQRKYYKRLFHLYEEEYNQDLAYNAIFQVVMLDFSGTTQISATDLITDIRSLQEKMELTGNIENAEMLLSSLAIAPEVFERYMLTGTIYMLLENHNQAILCFEEADKHALTGKHKAQIWLYYAYVYLRIEPVKAKMYLDYLDGQALPLDLQISYINRKAVYFKIKKDTPRAIKTIEDFLQTQAPDQSPKVLIRLANMHNDLGVFYSENKIIDEAEDHLKSALNIWKRYNIKRYFGLIYNNLADLYLKQGITDKAEHYSQLGYQYAKEINSPLNQALALLNQGEAKIKMGAFIEAEEKLYEAKKTIEAIPSDKFLDSITRNLALAKSKIHNFTHYHKFIESNAGDLISGKIRGLNPLVKTYFYYLYEISNPAKLKRLLTKNPHVNYSHLHEEEFYHNILSLIQCQAGNYEEALEELKLALQFAGEVKNSYASTVFYIFQALCFLGMSDYAKASELINTAKPLVETNSYRYWKFKIIILELLIDMMKPDVPLRDIFRRADDAIRNCLEFSYYQLVIELYQIKIQILVLMGETVKAGKLFTHYKKYLDSVTNGIPSDDRNNFLNINQYHLTDVTKFSRINHSPRKGNLKSRWNELLYNISNLNNTDRIKFLIEKGITQIIAPYQFRLMEYSEKISNYVSFMAHNCDKNSLIQADFSPYIDEAMSSDTIVVGKTPTQNFLIAPLISGRQIIGYLILTDNGELEFSKQEVSIIKAIRQNLCSLILRLQDYTQITQRIEKMNQLMLVSHCLMGIVDIDELEREIVSRCIDFTGGTRGFLIKRDDEGKFIFQVQLDETKQILHSNAGVSKTALYHCHQDLELLITFNALEDTRFRGSISVQDYYLHTIFCAPIVVDKVLYGILYLDNMNNNNREMYLNPEIINLLIEQITISIKNAKQYAAVIAKNYEMHALELLKDEFMAIVSHELNTPLTTLQGYVSRIKRNVFSDEEERKDVIGKVENQVRKLILTTQDITTMNNYNLMSSISKAPIDIYEILTIVQNEIEILLRQRKMFIRIEAELGLPSLIANWEAIHRMIYNLAVNAIRFTNDFGTVILGARRSAFQQEKIDGKDALILFIQDNGIGIPEDQIKNVFRKFYELNEIYAHKSGTIEYRSSGLGLGLSTAKRIVDLHNGNIWIKSKENEGTTVFVALPYKTDRI